MRGPTQLKQRLNDRALVREWNPDIEARFSECLDPVRRQRAEQRRSSHRVRFFCDGKLAHDASIEQERGDECLQNVADPADSDRLSPLEGGDCLRIAGKQSHAQVGSEGFGDGTENGPARPRRLDERDVRRTGNPPRVIVLDQQKIGTIAENRSQPSSAPLRHRCPRRILRPRRHDDRLRAAAHRAHQRNGQHAFVIHRHRHRHECLSSEQIENAREARVLDEHAIARAKLLAQDAFDSIQRTADNRDLFCGHSVRTKLAAGD